MATLPVGRFLDGRAAAAHCLRVLLPTGDFLSFLALARFDRHEAWLRDVRRAKARLLEPFSIAARALVTSKALGVVMAGGRGAGALRLEGFVKTSAMSFLTPGMRRVTSGSQKGCRLLSGMSWVVPWWRPACAAYAYRAAFDETRTCRRALGLRRRREHFSNLVDVDSQERRSLRDVAQ